ncbi:hypothetical protein EV193_1195 [Herbihabitans rhizosphaerae]|uniref:Uncharacterized protein n=1 Tax=Herbihabitans rhizosphaerae TaxID=1872711 RepID=A0A4Q7KBK8_9PSEU|nr:hypothetical protein [Herbihabitans rhizosphaerae]RZS29602.1 hypothetical protein EV193_1195 [Herbihabitans rhizosphaerae]
MDGYDVVIGELGTAAGKIGDTIALADGTNLEDTAGGNAQAFGDAGVHTALQSFGNTWELAKQILQSRSASAGQALLSTATSYRVLEQGNTTMFGGR